MLPLLEEANVTNGQYFLTNICKFRENQNFYGSQQQKPLLPTIEIDVFTTAGNNQS